MASRAHFRTLAAAHPALELPDRRLPRAPQCREIHRAVHGAGTFDFEISETCIQRVTELLKAIPGTQVEDVQIGEAHVESTGEPSLILKTLKDAGFPAAFE